MTTPTTPFTPAQLKFIDEKMAARPPGPPVQPVIAGKQYNDKERRQLFKRAFGYALKKELLAQVVGRNTEVTEEKVKTMGDLAGISIKAFREAQKNILTPNTFGQGGSLQPEFYSDEVIDALRDFTVTLPAGATSQDVPGKFNIGRLNSFAVADFVDEGEEPTIPTPSTGMVTLDPKKMMAVNRVTRSMIMDPGWATAERLTTDVLSALGVCADYHALIGSNSTGPKPAGLYYQVADANKFAQTAAFKQANLTSIIADLDKAERLVRESKIPFQGNSPGWVITSKTLMALKGLRESGLWTFRNQLDQGTLNGYPYFVTDSISGKGSGGGDPIIYGLWSQLYWGMKGGLEVALSDQQEFTKDNVMIKGIGYVDFKLRHQTAFAIIDGVTYT